MKTETDYLQNALQTFNNTNGVNWYGWKKEDDNGNKIPNSERMQYQYIKIIKDGATMPSEADVNAKIQELKDADIVPEYVKLRLTEYPNHNDCIHALLDGGDTLTELQAKRQATKLKFPKP